ncbi:MAG: hypothetical protein WDW36_003804 [Sanguina aurantia]
MHTMLWPFFSHHFQLEGLQHDLQRQQDRLAAQQAAASSQQVEQGPAAGAAHEGRLCAAEEGLAGLRQEVESVFKPALRALGTGVQELAAQAVASSAILTSTTSALSIECAAASAIASSAALEATAASAAAALATAAADAATATAASAAADATAATAAAAASETATSEVVEELAGLAASVDLCRAEAASAVTQAAAVSLQALDAAASLPLQLDALEERVSVAIAATAAATSSESSRLVSSLEAQLATVTEDIASSDADHSSAVAAATAEATAAAAAAAAVAAHLARAAEADARSANVTASLCTQQLASLQIKLDSRSEADLAVDDVDVAAVVAAHVASSGALTERRLQQLEEEAAATAASMAAAALLGQDNSRVLLRQGEQLADMATRLDGVATGAEESTVATQNALAAHTEQQRERQQQDQQQQGQRQRDEQREVLQQRQRREQQQREEQQEALREQLAEVEAQAEARSELLQSSLRLEVAEAVALAVAGSVLKAAGPNVATPVVDPALQQQIQEQQELVSELQAELGSLAEGLASKVQDLQGLRSRIQDLEASRPDLATAERTLRERVEEAVTAAQSARSQESATDPRLAAQVDALTSGMESAAQDIASLQQEVLTLVATTSLHPASDEPLPRMLQQLQRDVHTLNSGVEGLHRRVSNQGSELVHLAQGVTTALAAADAVAESVAGAAAANREVAESPGDGESSRVAGGSSVGVRAPLGAGPVAAAAVTAAAAALAAVAVTAAATAPAPVGATAAAGAVGATAKAAAATSSVTLEQLRAAGSGAASSASKAVTTTSFPDTSSNSSAQPNPPCQQQSPLPRHPPPLPTMVSPPQPKSTFDEAAADLALNPTPAHQAAPTSADPSKKHTPAAGIASLHASLDLETMIHHRSQRASESGTGSIHGEHPDPSMDASFESPPELFGNSLDTGVPDADAAGAAAVVSPLQLPAVDHRPQQPQQQQQQKPEEDAASPVAAQDSESEYEDDHHQQRTGLEAEEPVLPSLQQQAVEAPEPHSLTAGSRIPADSRTHGTATEPNPCISHRSDRSPPLICRCTPPLAGSISGSFPAPPTPGPALHLGPGLLGDASVTSSGDFGHFAEEAAHMAELLSTPLQVRAAPSAPSAAAAAAAPRSLLERVSSVGDPGVGRGSVSPGAGMEGGREAGPEQIVSVQQQQQHEEQAQMEQQHEQEELEAEEEGDREQAELHRQQQQQLQQQLQQQHLVGQQQPQQQQQQQPQEPGLQVRHGGATLPEQQQPQEASNGWDQGPESSDAGGEGLVDSDEGEVLEEEGIMDESGSDGGGDDGRGGDDELYYSGPRAHPQPPAAHPQPPAPADAPATLTPSSTTPEPTTVPPLLPIAGGPSAAVSAAESPSAAAELPSAAAQPPPAAAAAESPAAAAQSPSAAAESPSAAAAQSPRAPCPTLPSLGPAAPTPVAVPAAGEPLAAPSSALTHPAEPVGTQVAAPVAAALATSGATLPLPPRLPPPSSSSSIATVTTIATATAIASAPAPTTSHTIAPAATPHMLSSSIVSPRGPGGLRPLDQALCPISPSLPAPLDLHRPIGLSTTGASDFQARIETLLRSAASSPPLSPILSRTTGGSPRGSPPVSQRATADLDFSTDPGLGGPAVAGADTAAGLAGACASPSAPLPIAQDDPPSSRIQRDPSQGDSSSTTAQGDSPASSTSLPAAAPEAATAAAASSAAPSALSHPTTPFHPKTSFPLVSPEADFGCLDADQGSTAPSSPITSRGGASEAEEVEDERLGRSGLDLGESYGRRGSFSGSEEGYEVFARQRSASRRRGSSGSDAAAGTNQLDSKSRADAGSASTPPTTKGGTASRPDAMGHVAGGRDSDSGELEVFTPKPKPAGAAAGVVAAAAAAPAGALPTSLRLRRPGQAAADAAARSALSSQLSADLPSDWSGGGAGLGIDDLAAPHGASAVTGKAPSRSEQQHGGDDIDGEDFMRDLEAMAGVTGGGWRMGRCCVINRRGWILDPAIGTACAAASAAVTHPRPPDPRHRSHATVHPLVRGHRLLGGPATAAAAAAAAAVTGAATSQRSSPTSQALYAHDSDASVSSDSHDALPGAPSLMATSVAAKTGTAGTSAATAGPALGSATRPDPFTTGELDRPRPSDAYSYSHGLDSSSSSSSLGCDAGPRPAAQAGSEAPSVGTDDAFVAAPVHQSAPAQSPAGSRIREAAATAAEAAAATSSAPAAAAAAAAEAAEAAETSVLEDELGLGSYTMTLTTGSRSVGVPASGSVVVALRGAAGRECVRPVGAAPGRMFGRGAVDEVQVEAGRDLGDVTSLQVWHAPGGSPWFLEHVTVEQPTTGLEWQFLVNDWIQGGDRSTAKSFPAAGLSRANSMAGDLLNASHDSGQLSNPSPPVNHQPLALPLHTLAFSAHGRPLSALGDESWELSSELSSSSIGISQPPPTSSPSSTPLPAPSSLLISPTAHQPKGLQLLPMQQQQPQGQLQPPSHTLRPPPPRSPTPLRSSLSPLRIPSPGGNVQTTSSPTPDKLQGPPRPRLLVPTTSSPAPASASATPRQATRQDGQSVAVPVARTKSAFDTSSSGSFGDYGDGPGGKGPDDSRLTDSLNSDSYGDDFLPDGSGPATRAPPAGGVSRPGPPAVAAPQLVFSAGGRLLSSTPSSPVVSADDSGGGGSVAGGAPGRVMVTRLRVGVVADEDMDDESLAHHAFSPATLLPPAAHQQQPPLTATSGSATSSSPAAPPTTASTPMAGRLTLQIPKAGRRDPFGGDASFLEHSPSSGVAMTVQSPFLMAYGDVGGSGSSGFGRSASMGGKPPLAPGSAVVATATMANLARASFDRANSGGGGAAAVAASGRGGRGPDLHEAGESLELSGGSFTSRGSRRVRVSGNGSDAGDLDSEASYDGSEASLSAFAPDGVRPPAQATHLVFGGTSKKRVSWSEYAEELEFSEVHSGASSIASMTEEEIADALGMVGGAVDSYASVSYNTLDPNQAPSSAKSANAPSTPERRRPTAPPPLSPSIFEDIPLARPRGPLASGANPSASRQPRDPRRHGAAYKIKVFTANRMNAGLGSTTIQLEILGSSATIAHALPKERGSFQRDCVDRFTLYSDSGDMGDVVAIKLWHEGRSLGSAEWCVDRVEIENRPKCIRYVFVNLEREGWLRKGKRHALVLKPRVERIDEGEDLVLVLREAQAQLAQNTAALTEEDRRGLRGQIERINARLAGMGGAILAGAVALATGGGGRRSSSSGRG